MTVSQKYRLGCDIGGTFTDFVLIDLVSGRLDVHKSLTTPADPSTAVANGVDDLAREVPGFAPQTEHVIHGTTLIINAVLERKGAHTAVIATKGFVDILELRREIRYDIYDIGAAYPTPLVARPWRRELAERVYSDGRVLVPIDESEVEALIAELVAEGVETVAVCLLHAYANPSHEQAVARLAASCAPDLAISLSSDVLPEIREFERTSTTVINAYVKPLLAPYIDRLEARLAACGFDCGLFLMLSGGGITAPETARRYPVRLIESGPVGAVLAARHLGQQASLDDIMVFDMGGTTAKACLVHGGLLPITNEYEVDRVHRFKKGSGTPVAVPAVDLIEVCAGGGSIATINQLGLLEVGPQSAGAVPGPICYEAGGEAPTVTDADLVLGYLNPGYFLGGAMTLDPEGAQRGIARVIGSALGLSDLEAAWGIHDVVNENMAAAVRMYVAERGGDLSTCTLIACGGAGPVHAENVARKLGVGRIVVPHGAGVFSALGFLVAPVAYETLRSFVATLADIDHATLDGLYQQLEAEAAAVVRAAVPDAALIYRRAADMCYAGQGWSIRVTLDETDSLDVIARQFDRMYHSLYGYTYEDLKIQLVTARVTAEVEGGAPAFNLGHRAVTGSSSIAPKGERQAYERRARAMIAHKVYDAACLPAGTRLDGPAIFEEASSTLVVGPDATTEVDPRGWITVTLNGAGR